MLTKSKRTLICAVTIVVLATAVVAQNLITFRNLDDISGVPSGPAMAASTHHVNRLVEKYKRMLAERSRQYKVVQAKLAYALAHPKQKPGPSIVTNYQNIIVNFVDQRRAPIGGLHVIATIRHYRQPNYVINNLVTNADGAIKLPKLGPFPFGIDLALADTASVPEWQVTDVTEACRYLANPTGVRIASYSIPAPYKVASAIPIKSSRRIVLAQYETHQTINLSHIAVHLDIAAPAGSTVTSKLLGDDPVTVPDNGHVHCTVPRTLMEEGGPSIKITQMLPGGEAEAVISKYDVDLDDPHAVNAVTCPGMHLVTLAHVVLPNRISVMDDEATVIQAVGGAVGRKTTQQRDGSELWAYFAKGLALNMRPSPFSDIKGRLLERIRITSAAGGGLGGITVGSNTEDVVKALGVPDKDTTNLYEAGTTSHYLNDGVLIGQEQGKVTWIEIARCTSLLGSGTTAFEHRMPAKLFVNSYIGDPKAMVADRDALINYLRKVPSVILVDQKEKADLILNAQAEFTDHKDQVVQGLPFKYKCSTKLTYSIDSNDPNDVLYNRHPIHDKVVESSAGGDYTGYLAGGTILSAALATQKNNLDRILGGLTAGLTIYELNDQIRRTANRCPGIVASTVFDQMVQDINDQADYSVRVMSIDYTAGTFDLNIGTEDGIQVSSSDQPQQFELMIGRRALPASVQGNSADYYSAIVTQASAHSCKCALRHFMRKGKKTDEEDQESPGLDMLRRIPLPTTGEVSARASVRFLSFPIITDTDVKQADQFAEAQQKQQSNMQQNGNQKNGLGSIFQQLFKK